MIQKLPLFAIAIALQLQPASAQSPSPKAPARAAAPAAAAGSSIDSRSAAGLTEPARDAVLGAPVAGIIGEQFFKEGESVNKGDLIVELRKEVEQLQVARRRTLLDLAKTDLDRTKKLAKTTRSVSAEEVERAAANYAIARAEHEVALAELRQLQVFAPFSGEISDLFGLEAGEIARVQYPLVRLVDTKKVNFMTHIESSQSDTIKAGDEVELEIKSGKTVTRFNGSVTFVSPVIESSSGLLKIRVSFDNPEGKIRPGASGIMRW